MNASPAKVLLTLSDVDCCCPAADHILKQSRRIIVASAENCLKIMVHLLLAQKSIAFGVNPWVFDQFLWNEPAAGDDHAFSRCAQGCHEVLAGGLMSAVWKLGYSCLL